MNASIEGLNVVLVARQSSTRDDSLSTEDQLTRMRERCERDGANVVAEYVEKDVSGGRPLAKRPGAKLAVADIEGGRATVLMGAYFNRLFRSLKTQAEVLERVEAAGGRVIALDTGEISNGTAAQWLSGTMIGAMSEHQRLAVAEHTHDSKQRALDEGRPPFPRITPAYQRRADGRLEPHVTNAPLVREAIRMRLADPPASWERIARWLNERGIEVYTIKGERRQMTPTGLRKMLESRLMVGELHFGGFRPNLDAIEEPIMDHATYRRLRQSSAPRGRYGKSERLLARLGILRCSTCDGRMSVNSTSSKGVRYFYYVCGAPLCPRRMSIAVDVAEDTVRDEAIRLSAEVVGRASSEDEVEAARLERVAAEGALENAIRTLAGLGGEKATREVLAELEAVRDGAVDRHERLLASSASSGLTVRTGEDWDQLSFDGKRAIIKAVVGRAVVAPGRGPGRIAVEPVGE